MRSAGPHRHVHPAVFMFLILPFGVMGGYVTVALAYLFSKAGIPVAQVAALVAVGLVPTRGNSRGRRWWMPRSPAKSGMRLRTW
jgi:hypothetical protein